MKSIITALFITLMFSTSLVFAHGDHEKISPKAAIQVAAKATQQLTFKDLGFKVGKLSESWKNLTTDDLKLQSADGNRYIISANNKSDNQTIYFLMTISGEVLNVNSEARF
ncbi:hypothetical protein FGD67_18820 [Colwellia sp. M166]|jgi:hypothetical protein|uniref:DUF6488 family protein n=1 Tax=Colwellia sp. M166 TaxID=2583805 RepID=UPI00211E0B59|nr:DUF6488 family protein [Colwellia sp. M166]UUO25033.1 hypothetical protein FGD67_18820 [Colwellia sp. M166]|tara:strand:- start:6711 stop:7043 length:333 start_codon:yes stop_codon:yes gene_type:complete